MNKLNWGILGCGSIAHVFAQGFNKLNQGVLLAGASRSYERVNSFANKHGIKRVYTDYQALVTDPDIDVIYIATTHNFHFEHIKLCLEHGKHVLCEKPFTVNAQQCAELMAIAKKHRVFMMEAVWTRFLPAIVKLSHLLDEKVIGDVKSVKADFCITGDVDDEHRLMNKALAGGALLDLGIYPITMAAIVFGEHPLNIKSSSVIGNTGVDERSYYLFEYSNGKTAVLSSSFSHYAPTEAVICGSRGYIRVPNFIAAKELHIHIENQPVQIISLPFEEEDNFTFEIEHVTQCILAGAIESTILPHSETLNVLTTMDTLRSQWKLTYPNE